jgi:hypothetical protein
VVTITGAGWAPGQVVTIAVDGEPGPGTDVTADDDGAFTHDITLPETAAAKYRVVATGQCADAPVEMAEIVAEVAAEPEVVTNAPVTCQQADAVAPFIMTDLADYPPGALVTLTGGNWVAGQTIEILVEDDGLAEAERGPWSHAATVTADAQGAFTHQFNIAPYFVADYTVVATGECREARTSFTDAIQMSMALSPTRVPASSATTFWATFTNKNTGTDISTTNNLGCVRIAVPSGYSVVSASASVTSTSGGKSWSAATPSTSEIILLAGSDPARLGVDEQVTVQFSATTASGTGSSSITATGRTGMPTACPTGGGAAFGAQSISVTRTDNKFRASATFVTASGTATQPSVAGLSQQTFRVRITNNGAGGGDGLGSAKILVPAGFTNVSGLSVTNSGGFTWSVGYSGTEGKIRVAASDSGNRIFPNGTIQVTFTATAPEPAGPRTFTVEAWKDHDCLDKVCSDQYGFSSQPVMTVTAAGPRLTTTALSLNAGTNPSTFGQSVTFRASVTATGGDPSGVGTVTFKDGATILCNEVTLTASTNTADCTTTALAVGSRSITAVYSGFTAGSPQFDGSTSSALPHTVNEATPTASDLALNCTPNPNPATVNAGQPVTVDCTYSAVSSLGTRTVTLSQITVPAPSGWSIASTVGTVAGTTLTINPNAPISYNEAPAQAQSYAFSYTLTPDCTASTTNQNVAITSQFTFNGGSATAGAAFTGQVARTDASALAISLQTPSALGWTQPFSFTANTVTGSIVYRLTASGCGGWNVQVSASDLIYSGDNNGTAIPAANLQLTSAGSPAVVTGSGTGVTAQPASGPMSPTSPKKVLAADIGSGIGSYDQQLHFSLEIPANTRVGSYKSTIFITSATGP